MASQYDTTTLQEAKDASNEEEGVKTPSSSSSSFSSESKPALFVPTKKSGRLVQRGLHKTKRKTKLTYTMRVTLTFALVAAMTALIASLLLVFAFEQHFNAYTHENMETAAHQAADRVATLYESAGGWDSDIDTVADMIDVMYPGVGIAILDDKGRTHYDSTVVLAYKDESSFMSLRPKSDNQVAHAEIVVDGSSVGEVQVWVYGSSGLLRQSDIAFKDATFRIMVVAAIVAIILASLIGYLFARNLVKPINAMSETAKAIRDGDLSARTNMRGEDEVSSLGETFDQMADRIEQDRQQERRLTTDVAHELRTPLMAIRATVEAIIDGVFEADEERLETINSEVKRLSRLVDAILKLSRLESRTNSMKQEIVDVNILVSEIVSTHEAYVNDSGLSLSFEGQEGTMIRGDADMIRQATANLISNAVRYTPEGGKINVYVRKGDIMASICVEDTGIGLSSEDAKMVFGRFWRADAGRQRETGGLGVGLSVVKEIVDRHGGWVQVEGQPNVGARFTIHIPLYEEDNSQTSSEPTRSFKSKKKNH